MKELKKFLRVVNNNNFIEWHEVLEDKWKEWKKIPSLKEESFILKGLINGSTALALKVKNKNLPALRVWNTLLKYSPLIDKIDSTHTLLYKEAKELLYVKYEEFFNKASL